MFGIFKKNKISQMEKEFRRLSEQAMNAQRNGDIERYSELSQIADELQKKIELLLEKQDHQ